MIIEGGNQKMQKKIFTNIFLLYSVEKFCVKVKISITTEWIEFQAISFLDLIIELQYVTIYKIL